ncbi:hypothetical protein BDZ45DRAFT_699444 [Acephala macrosclerotiorum]|nr:hypothetical protein BDZ45DRAFT_699444 [Acephala macrosclerotiorum]
MIKRHHQYSLEDVERFWEFFVDLATGGIPLLQDVSLHIRDIPGLVEGTAAAEDQARLLMQAIRKSNNLKALYLILSREDRGVSLLPSTEGSWYFILGGVLQQASDAPGPNEKAQNSAFSSSTIIDSHNSTVGEELKDTGTGRLAVDDSPSTLKSFSIDDATIVPALSGTSDTEHKAVGFEDLSYDMRFLLWKWVIKNGRFIETKLDIQPVSLARLDGRQNNWKDFILAVHFIPYHAGLVPIFFKNEIKAKKSFYSDFVRRYKDLILLSGRQDNIFHLNFAWPVLEKLFTELKDRLSPPENDPQRSQPKSADRLSFDFIISAPIIVGVHPQRPLERLSLNVLEIPGQYSCAIDTDYIDVFIHLIAALGVKQLNLVLTASRLTDTPTHGGHLWTFKPGGSSASTTEMKIHKDFMLATKVKSLIKKRALPGLEVNVVQWDISDFCSNGK